MSRVGARFDGPLGLFAHNHCRHERYDAGEGEGEDMRTRATSRFRSLHRERRRFQPCRAKGLAMDAPCIARMWCADVSLPAWHCTCIMIDPPALRTYTPTPLHTNLQHVLREVGEQHVVGGFDDDVRHRERHKVPRAERVERLQHVAHRRAPLSVQPQRHRYRRRRPAKLAHRRRLHPRPKPGAERRSVSAGLSAPAGRM
jgi:hypothetical protein